MNYKIVKIEEENKVTLTFNFTQEEFENAIKQTNIEDRNQAIQEAVNSLINDSYIKAIQEEALNVVSYPTLTPNGNICIDSGCVFGYSLTAMIIDMNNEYNYSLISVPNKDF